VWAARHNGAAHAVLGVTPLLEPIAVIGLGCRFPGAPDPGAYWRLLRDGVDAIHEVPPDRWDIDAYYDPQPTTPGKMSTRWGGFLPAVDLFDRTFFRLSAREAAAMDPQQRLLLEVAWEALEDGGQAIDRLAGTSVGVFVGISSVDYGLLHVRAAASGDPYVSTGSALSIAANRLSYLLDFRGPSLAIDTACSSSLVALHLACNSLRDGECDLAVVGGVNVLLVPDPTIAFSKAGFMAPDGRCKAFDARADGYVRGEGAGAVVLKSLTRAVADGDPIYALVRGSAVNQDGRSNGLTAPNRWAQEAVLREAYRRAGVVPSEVAYVEAHGTGTALGDPIEVNALAAVLGDDRPLDRPLSIGSVKSNVGHLEAAAGIAALIKTVLALHHRALPPSLHVEQPTPHVDWAEMPVRIQVGLEPWPHQSLPAYAGVSAFGFGGTNAHVVLEEAPPVSAADPPDSEAARTHLLPLSARDPVALHSLAAAYLARIGADPSASLRDVCYTASARRAHHAHHLAIVGGSRSEVRDGLDAFVRGQADRHVFTTHQPSARRPRLVFVFSGHGGQWLGMGRQMFAQEPVFRRSVENCDAALRAETGWSVVDWLSQGAPLDAVDVVQPVLFAMQVALAELWRAYGVEPDAVVGHSLGEIAAAHVAGGLPLAAAARVVSKRSQLLSRPVARGAMLAVELGRADAERLLAGVDGRLAIAACNGPRSTVVSGDIQAITALSDELAGRQVLARSLHADVAFHGPWIEPLAAELRQELEDLSPRALSVPLYSSSLPGRVADDDRLDGDFWARNLHSTVFFSAAVEQLLADGYTAFVELGPQPTLLRPIQDTARQAGTEVIALPSMRHGADERTSFLESLAGLYVGGYAVDWRRHAEPGARCTPLPAYPWQRERCWSESLAQPNMRPPESGHPLLGRHFDVSALPGTHVWEIELGPTQTALFNDHRVQGTPVLAAAAYLEMLVAAAAAALGTGGHELSDVAFEHLLSVVEGTRTVQLTLSPAGDRASLRVASAAAAEPGQSRAWITHALATAHRQSATTAPEALPMEQLRSRCRAEVSAAQHYADLADAGLAYGPRLRLIERVWVGDHEVIARLHSATSDAAVGFDSAALDACLQLVAHAAGGEVATTTALPIGLSRLRTTAHIPAERWGYVRQTQPGVYDVFLLGSDGRVTVEASGVRLRHLTPQALKYELVWRATAEPETAHPATHGGRWLIFADRLGVGNALAEALCCQGAQPVLVSSGPAYRSLDAQHFEVDPSSAADVQRLLGDLAEPPDGVVYLWGLDATMGQAPLDGALHLVQALGARTGETRRFWLITRDALAVVPGDRLDGAAQSPLWGFGRAVALEYPSLRCTLVDVPSGPASETAELLDHELRRPAGDPQVAIRGPARYVPRLAPLDVASNGPDPMVVHADGTYVITGGLGGLGLQTARWLVEQGARRLVLIGRSAPSTDAQALIRDLEQAGATVVVAHADVAQRDQLAAALDEARCTGAPLRGVVHAAGILDDVALADLDGTRLQQAMAPKMTGAWNLHELCAADPLDWFVLFSSVAALFGPPRQASHAAGNAYLDALAHFRRARGLPATSVNWGPWSEVGVAVRNGSGARLQQLGIGSLTPPQGLAALGEVLRPNSPGQVAIVRADWRRLRRVFADSGADGSVLAELALDDGPLRERSTRALHKELEALANDDERRKVLLVRLRGQVARMLRVPIDSVELNSPLVTLGLDSLVALELQHWLEVELGARMSVVSLLSGPSLSELAAELFAGWSTLALGDTLPASAAEPPGTYPLSFGERGLWFMYQLEPRSAAYLLARAIRLHGDLNLAALRRAIKVLVDRHAALRSTFFSSSADGEPVRRVHPSTHEPDDTSLSVVDAVDWSDTALSERMAAVANEPFDIERAPPVRILLFRRTPSEHILMVVVHHIVIDVWSLAVLTRDLAAAYAAQRTGRPVVLTPIHGHLSDFAAWQHHLMADAAVEASAAFWSGQLANDPPPLDLSTNHVRPAIQTFRGAAQRFSVDAALTRQLKALAAEHRTTLYTILLAAFQVLLHRYTGQTDIAVGSPVAGRTHAEFAGTMGYFVNTLVLRAHPRAELPFSVFLDQVRDMVLSALQHQEYPFQRLVERLRPERGSDRSPLFQILFGVESLPQLGAGDLAALVLGHDGGSFILGDLAAESVAVEHSGAQFDLALTLAETTDSQLLATLVYNLDLFDADTAARMAGHFASILGGVCQDPQRAVGDLPLLTELERQQQTEWNATDCDYPLDQALHQLVEAQVERTPDAIAVRFEDQELTYRQLNERANQLAHHLQSLGVGPDILVGACLERSLELVVGLLGVLKAGGAYVALDPDQPPARLKALVEDALPVVVLTQCRLVDRLPQVAVLCLDSDWRTFDHHSTVNLAAAATPDNLAYVIYTSGSTGQPKGVLSVHRGIVNRLLWMQDAYRLEPGERVLHKTALGFDVSVWELFWPLIAGGCMVVARLGGQREPDYLAGLIAEQDVSTVHFVPSLLASFLDEPRVDRCGCLKRVICSGEALPPDLVQKFCTHLTAELYNLYGPTEASIDVTAWHCSAADIGRAIPIGRPIANTRLYVLDERLQPLPVGVAGELYIGGYGLARGYLKRPSLTAERFITDPVAGAPWRLYRTGDRGRWRPDGALEFLGRLDDQVKIRGVRVEPGEVAVALRQHAAITDTVVAADDQGEPRLVAYIVPTDPGQPPGAVELRGFLRARLPEPLVPAVFVPLTAIPRLPNGKLDRHALPPLADRPSPPSNAAAPRDLVEWQLTSVWEELLGVQVGLDDDFFALGGHSLLALRLIGRLDELFGERLPVAVLLRAPTVRALAEELRAAPGARSIPLVVLRRGAGQPLFLATAGSGDLLALASLARHLGLDVPVYGLQPTSATPDRASIEQLAAAYVGSIRHIQPSGPYRLGGYSVGGVVAYEAARQLCADGLEVGLLALLDTYFPGSKGHPYTAVSRAQRLAAHLPLLRPDSSAAAAGIHDDALAAQLQAMRTYVAGPYPGRVTLLVAERSLGGLPRAERSWRRAGVAGVDVHVVPGRHDTMLREPHLLGVAEQLRVCLSGDRA
jgi:hybrid polyketide synthase/nonribosomal peptide synthetase FtdB